MDIPHCSRVNPDPYLSLEDLTAKISRDSIPASLQSAVNKMSYGRDAETETNSDTTPASTNEETPHPLRSHPLVVFRIPGFTAYLPVAPEEVNSLESMQATVHKIVDAEIETVTINSCEYPADDPSAILQHLRGTEVYHGPAKEQLVEKIEGYSTPALLEHLHGTDVYVNPAKVTIDISVNAHPVRSVDDLCCLPLNTRAWTHLTADGMNRWHDLRILPREKTVKCHCAEWTKSLTEDHPGDWRPSSTRHRLSIYHGGIVDGTFTRLHQALHGLHALAYILKWRQKHVDNDKFFERAEIEAVGHESMHADLQLISQQAISTLHAVAIVPAVGLRGASPEHAYRTFDFLGDAVLDGKLFYVYGDRGLCGACSSPQVFKDLRGRGNAAPEAGRAARL